jgi:glycyl-tRNA synthetase beta chain
MRWGVGVGPWVRPVHGIVSLYDGEVLDLELFGVLAGATTVGHPILSPRQFKVRNAAEYYRKLSARGIEIRFDARRRSLEEHLHASAEAAGGTLVEDSELLEKLASICEIPGLLEGSFDREFLVLPREVLTTSLRDHQSAFSVQQDGELLPVFLTVMDRPDDPEGRVRAGNEWVVAARLADARFFYQEDRKVPLAERGRRLEQLVFHQQLGSYAAKAERLASLCEWLSQELGWSDEAEGAVEAARLLKADLTSEMVKEFTSLQGIMGGIYAREEGYPEGIWQAIYDQYLPQTPSDAVPRGRVGQITALADRIDSLVGIFGLGHVPSGSKDPFGLRRAAQGAVRIVLEANLPLDLDLVAARAARLYGDTLATGGEQILAALRPFLHDRVRYLLGLEGYSYDEVEAALAAGGSDLPDLRARVEALHEARKSESFLSVVLAAKRILNIIKESQEFSLDPKLLEDEAEKSLYASFQALRADVEEAAAAGKYQLCLQRIAELAPVLDRFFVEVLVMDENEQLKQNRLALLQAIHRTISRSARLSEVVVDKGEYRSREN